MYRAIILKFIIKKKFKGIPWLKLLNVPTEALIINLEQFKLSTLILAMTIHSKQSR